MKKLVPTIAGAFITAVILIMSVNSPDSGESAVPGANTYTYTYTYTSETNENSTVDEAADCPIKVTVKEGIQPGGSIHAKVKRVVDGDTLRALYKGEEYKIRLLCIDTPETVKVNVDEQPYGKIASEKLNEMVLDKEVTLIFEKDIEDKYDRLLAYVLLEDGTCVNAYLVENGFARVDIVKPNSVHKDYFDDLQDNAISEKRGLWSLPDDKRPFIKNDKGYYVPRYVDSDAA